MPTWVEYLLWSIGTIIAVGATIFSVVAAVSSTRADHRIKEFITTSYVEQESYRLFFTNMKILQSANNEVIKQIKKQQLTFFDYVVKTKNVRFPLITNNQKVFLARSPYKECLKAYTSAKRSLDKSFRSFYCVEWVTNKNLLPAEMKNKLIVHHTKMLKAVGDVLTHFSVFATNPIQKTEK